MKVLLATGKLVYGSETSYSIGLARALRRRGIDFQVCSTGGDLRSVFVHMGAETYVAKFNLFSFRRLVLFLREFGPDIMHVQNPAALGLGRRLHPKLRVPLVLTVHTLVGDEKHELYLSGGNLAGVIAVNEVIRASLVNDYGISKERIRVIRSGVDLDRFDPSVSRVLAEDRVPVIGSVGRLEVPKGHEYFIRMARQIVEAGRSAHFMIIGEGPDEVRLRGLVAELGLRSHLTFSSPVPNAEDIYRVLDIVVIPTVREGVGAVALEAMAMGRPIVASGVGDILNIIEDGRTGSIFPKGDIETLTERVVRLLEDPALARQTGSDARRFVEEHYSLDRTADETAEFYEEVLAKGKAT